jgi:hypothetical protein
MLGLVTKRRLVRELQRQRYSFEWAVTDALMRRDEAERELVQLREQVADAIGLHIGRPYREDVVGGVTFPIFLSAYVLKELDKRFDRRALVTMLETQFTQKLLVILNEPGRLPGLPRTDLREGWGR